MQDDSPSKLLQALPADPAELMVVPHAHKRPTRARVLQIGIVQIVAVDSTIVSDVCRNMKIANLFTVFVANDVAQATVVYALRPVFWVPERFRR